MAVGLCMVMFLDDPNLSIEEFKSSFSDQWPDAGAIGDPQGTDDSLSLDLPDCSIVIAKMPAALPWSELEGPCATSLLWPEATQQVPQHQTHAIVTVTGDLDPIRIATRVTQAATALIHAVPSSQGVYWGNAALLVPGPLFVEMATELLPEVPPLYLWVDVRVGMDQENSSSGFTTGMSTLGLMELEAENAAEPPGELRERLFGLVGYLVENGLIINDGDTIGEDQYEKIRVVYADSTFGHPEKVMRLVYEQSSPKSPWWKLW